MPPIGGGNEVVIVEKITIPEADKITGLRDKQIAALSENALDRLTESVLAHRHHIEVGIDTRAELFFARKKKCRKFDFPLEIGILRKETILEMSERSLEIINRYILGVGATKWEAISVEKKNAYLELFGNHPRCIQIGVKQSQTEEIVLDVRRNEGISNVKVKKVKNKPFNFKIQISFAKKNKMIKLPVQVLEDGGDWHIKPLIPLFDLPIPGVILYPG